MDEPMSGNTLGHDDLVAPGVPLRSVPDLRETMLYVRTAAEAITCALDSTRCSRPALAIAR